MPQFQQNMKNPSCKDAYDAKERAHFLELAELLDALASSGQDAQDVESDLKHRLSVHRVARADSGGRLHVQSC